MITSNIVGDRVVPQTRGSFFKTADSIKDYAELMDPLCRNSDGKGGSDHFMSVIRSADALWKKYEYIGIDEAFEIIKRTPSLLSWFSMIAVIMIYGLQDTNHIKPVKIEIRDDLPFLRVWKNKLETTDHLDNTLTDDEYDENSLNVYSFDGMAGDSVAGCCSRRYFIIPSREITLTGGEVCPWKELYLQLVQSPDSVNRTLFKRTSPLARLLLTLSARSLPDNTPLQMIKDMIHIYLAPPAEEYRELPATEVGDMLLYRVNNGQFPISMFSEKISFIYSEDRLEALYPFEPGTADMIESGICSVSSITMTARESAIIKDRVAGAPRLDCASVTATFIRQLTFEAENGRQVTIPFKFTETHSYNHRAINCLSNLPTFCMYPDIDLEYENACTSYTYFSNSDSHLDSEFPEEVYDRRNAIIDMSSCGLDAFGDIFKETKGISGNNIKIITANADKPTHLIKVNSGRQYLGTVVNLKRSNRSRCSALLTLNKSESIDCTPADAPRTGRMSAFIDLGALSCSVGYKLDEGTPYFKGASGGTSVVRPLLAQYDEERYSELIGSEASSRITPCLLSYSDHVANISEFTPYAAAFLPLSPITPKQSGPKLKYFGLDKRTLEKERRISSAMQQGEINSLKCAQGVMHNLCYRAACHAVNKGCTRLSIYSTVPSENMSDVTKGIVKSCADALKSSFDLTFENMAESLETHMMYDGLVSAVPLVTNNRNALTVNVEIGHSYTKLCGILCKGNNELSLISYSAIPFGGKELIHKCVYDTLHNAGSIQLAENVLYSKQGIDTIFTNTKNGSLSLENTSKEIIARFFPDADHRGVPRNSIWQDALGRLADSASLGGTSSERPVLIAFRSDLMFRYALLMPVVLEFMKKSVELCSTVSAVKLCFTGGGAKGFSCADKYCKNGSSFTDKVKDYFQSRFPGIKLQFMFGSENELVQDIAQTNALLGRITNDISDSRTKNESEPKEFEKFKKFCLDIADELSVDSSMRNVIYSVFSESRDLLKLFEDYSPSDLTPDDGDICGELVLPASYMLLAEKIFSAKYHTVHL